jgi:hypothetical protein
VIDYYRLYAFFGTVNEDFLDISTFSTGNTSAPTFVSTAYLNNDNILDLVVTNSGNDNVGIFLGLGFGFFAEQITFPTGNGSKPSSLAIGDFNNDNKSDIAVTNYGYDSVGIFLGYGNGSFQSQRTYSTGILADPYSPVVGDLNNDTQLDIVVANYQANNILIFYGVGDGTFEKKMLIPMGYGSSPSFIALGDVNNDSLLDIAVTKYDLGTIEILSNKC